MTANSSFEVLEESKIEREMTNLSLQVQLSNALLKAVCPGIKVASIFVTPEPLNHVEGAKLESTLSRFTLDSKEYRLIGESGSVKSGKHYAMDTHHERPLGAHFSDWLQAAVTHFGILVSSCMVRIQSPDDRPSTRNDTRPLVCSPAKQHRFPVLQAGHAPNAIVIALRCSRREPALQRSEVGVENRIAASGAV